MSKNSKRPIVALLRFVGFPVRFLAALLHCRFFPYSWKKRKIRKRTELAVGIVVMVGASALACYNPFHGIVEPIVDAFAYLVHGIGSAPIIESILTAVTVE